MFFKHFASKNQLPGLSVNGTLVENGLGNLLKFGLRQPASLLKMSISYAESKHSVERFWVIYLNSEVLLVSSYTEFLQKFFSLMSTSSETKRALMIHCASCCKICYFDTL